MNAKDMFKSTIMTKFMAIILALLIYSFAGGHKVVLTVLGVLALILFLCYSFRVGMALGHESAGVSANIGDIIEGNGNDDQVDKEMYAMAWSWGNGIKGFFAGSVIGYALNCAYIICMKLVPDTAVCIITRIIAWMISLPYWLILNTKHTVFNSLSTDIIIMLMAGPFVIPLAQFLGYLMGPKLWQRTERAMAQGKRRAKARSRVMKKKQPQKRQKGPEI